MDVSKQSRIICYYCNKQGHIEKFCRTKLQNKLQDEVKLEHVIDSDKRLPSVQIYTTTNNHVLTALIDSGATASLIRSDIVQKFVHSNICNTNRHVIMDEFLILDEMRQCLIIGMDFLRDRSLINFRENTIDFDGNVCEIISNIQVNEP